MRTGSYLNKAYLFYLIFHLLLSAFAFYYITFHWLETDAPLKYTVDMWGMFHMNRALLTCAVVDPMHMLEGLKFFRRKSKEVTTASRAKILSAEDEDELTAEHDEFFSDHFDFSKNYGESLAIFTAISCFATMHPSIMLCKRHEDCWGSAWVAFFLECQQ